MLIKRCPIILALFLLYGCSTHRYSVSDSFVSFFLTYRKANSVEFLYSIDDFRSHPASEIKDGLWEVRVPFHHEFSYFYKVDGKVFVPECELREEDDFGFENCLFHVHR